jgi:hypothetical protein
MGKAEGGTGDLGVPLLGMSQYIWRLPRITYRVCYVSEELV